MDYKKLLNDCKQAEDLNKELGLNPDDNLFDYVNSLNNDIEFLKKEKARLLASPPKNYTYTHEDLGESFGHKWSSVYIKEV